MGERKTKQESGSGEQIVSMKPKYRFSEDYIHEQFFKHAKNGKCTIRCPFGYLCDETLMRLERRYAIVRLEQNERGTTYEVEKL
jgi:hypothetical protein